MEDSFKTKGSKWAFEDMQDVNSRISFEIKEIVASDYVQEAKIVGPLSEDLDQFQFMITNGYVYPLAYQLLRITEKIYNLTELGQTLQLREAQFLLNEIRALRYNGFNSAPAMHYLELDF
jgi:hypothetical protein